MILARELVLILFFVTASAHGASFTNDTCNKKQGRYDAPCGKPPSTRSVCDKNLAKYSSSCKTKGNVTKEDNMTTTVYAYAFEDCKGSDFVSVKLTHPIATEQVAYSTCSVAGDKFSTGQSRKEVISSLGTTLTVELDSEKYLTTQVSTQDGHISCKADSKEENPINWWCGVMIKPATKYTEIAVVDNYQLSPLFFNQKKLKDFLPSQQTQDEAASQAPTVKQ